MHKKIIEEASHEQLKDFAYKTFDMIKRSVDKETYDDIEIVLYEDVYGLHFTKWLLEKALSCMENEDGTIGGHWTLEQTTNVARSNGIEFKHFNECDWCYTMNMVYSDYYGSVPNDLGTYFRLAKNFLEDKDAPEGKALIYYLSMKK